MRSWQSVSNSNQKCEKHQLYEKTSYEILNYMCFLRPFKIMLQQYWVFENNVLNFFLSSFLKGDRFYDSYGIYDWKS